MLTYADGRWPTALMPGRVEADMRYWMPPSASGSSLGVHPGHDWGWFFPVSPLETYGPWTLWPRSDAVHAFIEL